MGLGGEEVCWIAVGAADGREEKETVYSTSMTGRGNRLAHTHEPVSTVPGRERSMSHMAAPLGAVDGKGQTRPRVRNAVRNDEMKLTWRNNADQEE